MRVRFHLHSSSETTVKVWLSRQKAHVFSKHAPLSPIHEVTIVKDYSEQDLEFFGGAQGAERGNELLRYVQSMSPETIAQLSKPVTPEVLQVMEHNVVGLLGGLPSQHFDISVTTSREDLGRLLASAMMSGYLLRSAEQRMTFERSLMTPDATEVE